MAKVCDCFPELKDVTEARERRYRAREANQGLDASQEAGADRNAESGVGGLEQGVG